MTRSRSTTILTGASSGIGRALAGEMAEPGHTLVLVARREGKLRNVADEVENEGGTARVEPMDVRNESGMREIVQNTYEDEGQLDRVIANAGVSWKTEAHDLDPGAVRDTFEINVNGALHLFEPALDVMFEQGRGHLVAVSSMASFRGLPGKGAYCASKAALARMAESFRLDLSEDPVDVTTIYPGYVQTPMTDHYPDGDLPFLVPVDEAAQTMRTAIEKRKKKCLFPWQMALLVKAMKFLPSGLVDTLVQRTAASMTEAAPTGSD